MIQTGTYTITDCTEEFLLIKGVDAKKYFVKYLVIAKRVWQELFWNTLNCINSEWMVLKAGTPYNYIDVPNGAVRILSVSTNDSNGNVQPIYYNSNLNVVSKPSVKKCGCSRCDCGGLCDDINSSLAVITKVLFTVNNQDYIEKTWLKVAPNGDVHRYREVPTKKYYNLAGDVGSPPFTVVTEKFQDVICKLQVRDCGCPVDTVENLDMFVNTFGCFLPVNACCRNTTGFLGVINGNCKGEVKVSGDKIFYKPSSSGRLPDYLLVNYQSSGLSCSSAVIVPEYAIKAMFDGIQHYSTLYNNNYSEAQKEQNGYRFVDAQTKIISFLNPLPLDWLSTVQDAKILW